MMKKLLLDPPRRNDADRPGNRPKLERCAGQNRYVDADRLSDGKLTEKALVGTWCYTQPGVKFESDDFVTEMAGTTLQSTITSRLERAYAYAGIRAGSGSFTFKDDDTFDAVLGKYTLSGTYAFDAATHVVTLRFAQGKIALGTLEGHAYIDGKELLLVFPVTKFVKMATALGSKSHRCRP